MGPQREGSPSRGGYAHLTFRPNHPASDHIYFFARTNRPIVVDASLHNFRELAESCGLASARDPQVVPIARVLLAATKSGARIWPANCAVISHWRSGILQPRALCRARCLWLSAAFSGTSPGEFAFASEVQSLVAADFVELKPNMVALSDFIVHSTHRAFEASFVQGINRVRAGHYAVIGSSGMTQVRYLPVPGIALNVDVGGEEELASGFRRMFKASVAANLASVDGPLAIELSCGYDSSAITLLVSEIWQPCRGVAPRPSYRLSIQA